MAATLSSQIEPRGAGFSFEPVADLSDESVRRKLSPSAIRAFVKIVDAWHLSESEACELLGGVASSTYHVWKKAPDGRKLDQDTVTRISLLLGIFKALRTYFGKQLGDQWITLANRGALFAGQTPLEFLVRAGLPGMVELRHMLDAWCEGS